MAVQTKTPGTMGATSASGADVFAHFLPFARVYEELGEESWLASF
jgi:hypothetical protein